MILTNLLSSSKYIIVNKDLIKILGLHEAIILGELCSEYGYWKKIKKLVNKQFFFSTRDNIEENTGINAHFQRIAIRNLEEKGIIEMKKMGIPCKAYYKINENVIIEYLRNAKETEEKSELHDMNDKTNKDILDESLDVHEVNNKKKTVFTTGNSRYEEQDIYEVHNINNNNINNKNRVISNYNQREYPPDYFDNFYTNLNIAKENSANSS